MNPDAGEHVVLISTDGHCGADLWGYKPYLEHRYHDLFDAWAGSFHDAWAEDADQHRSPNSRAGVASMSAPLNWDSQERLEYIDAEGVAAEVLFPNTAPPFYPSGALTAPGPRNREEYALRFAGLRAHNRWLADFCSEAPERRAGFAQLFLDDVDDAVAEVEWARDAGLRGVHIPNDHVLRMASLYYPEYDPLWAACADLAMPVHRHASFPTEASRDGGSASVLVGMIEIHFYPVRAIGHLILSGVFERHPNLKYVTTELTNAREVLRYLASLDQLVLNGVGEGAPLYELVEEALSQLHRAPSDYFATNCYIAGPTNDLREAFAAGAPNLMWGADIPHSEGTAPYTIETIRATLSDLPSADLAALLSTRAAELYGFDLDALQPVADRIGPTFTQLQTPLAPEERPRYPEESRCSIFHERRLQQHDERSEMTRGA